MVLHTTPLDERSTIWFSKSVIHYSKNSTDPMLTDGQIGSGEGRIGRDAHTDSYGMALCSWMPSYVPSSTSCAGSGTKS